MSFLDSIFGGNKSDLPDPIKTDPAVELRKGTQFNEATFADSKDTLEDLTNFFSQLFASQISDSTKALDSANRDIASDYQTGYGSKEDQDFINQQVAETNLSRGYAPGAGIAQFNKGRIWRDVLDQRRQTGFQMGENLIQRDNNIALSLLSPAENFLNANTVNPTAFLQTAINNNDLQNQTNIANSIQNNQQSGFGSLLSGIVGKVGGSLVGSIFGPAGTALGGAIGGSVSNLLKG